MDEKVSLGRRELIATASVTAALSGYRGVELDATETEPEGEAAQRSVGYGTPQLSQDAEPPSWTGTTATSTRGTNDAVDFDSAAEAWTETWIEAEIHPRPATSADSGPTSDPEFGSDADAGSGATSSFDSDSGSDSDSDLGTDAGATFESDSDSDAGSDATDVGSEATVTETAAETEASTRSDSGGSTTDSGSSTSGSGGSTTTESSGSTTTGSDDATAAPGESPTESAPSAEPPSEESYGGGYGLDPYGSPVE